MNGGDRPKWLNNHVFPRVYLSSRYLANIWYLPSTLHFSNVQSVGIATFFVWVFLMSLLIKIWFCFRGGLRQLPELQTSREILFFLFSMESSGLSLYYSIGFIIVCTVPINLPFLPSHVNVYTFIMLCHLQLYLCFWLFRALRFIPGKETADYDLIVTCRDQMSSASFLFGTKYHVFLECSCRWELFNYTIWIYSDIIYTNWIYIEYTNDIIIW